MAEDYSAPEGGRSSGVLGSIRNLVSTIVSLAHTRLQLLANEVQEAKLRLGQMLLFSVLALFFVALAVVFISLLVIVLFWDSNRILVIGAFAAGYLLLAVTFGAVAFKHAGARPKLFEASLSELARDKERLSL